MGWRKFGCARSRRRMLRLFVQVVSSRFWITYVRPPNHPESRILCNMLCRTIIARTMALASGAKIGAYEVLAPLGAAGMGEVYRARDTKLDRDVALKILPESFATDPDRSMRCQREAKTEVKGGGVGNIDHL